VLTGAIMLHCTHTLVYYNRGCTWCGWKYTK
jgi:hypothetical protein